MSNATRGIKDHRMFEAFERCHKHLLKTGWPAFDAMRGALAIAFATTEDFTPDQAWQAADELMSPYATQPAMELESTATESNRDEPQTS